MADGDQAQPNKKQPARPKRIVVDEIRDRAVSVGATTVVFRPGQVLESDHLRSVAAEYGILTREQ